MSMHNEHIMLLETTEWWQCRKCAKKLRLDRTVFCHTQNQDIIPQFLFWKLNRIIKKERFKVLFFLTFIFSKLCACIKVC